MALGKGKNHLSHENKNPSRFIFAPSKKPTLALQLFCSYQLAALCKQPSPAQSSGQQMPAHRRAQGDQRSSKPGGRAAIALQPAVAARALGEVPDPHRAFTPALDPSQLSHLSNALALAALLKLGCNPGGSW